MRWRAKRAPIVNVEYVGSMGGAKLRVGPNREMLSVAAKLGKKRARLLRDFLSPRMIPCVDLGIEARTSPSSFGGAVCSGI